MDKYLIKLTKNLKEQMANLEKAREVESEAFLELKEYLGLQLILVNRDAALNEALQRLGKYVLKENTD